MNKKTSNTFTGGPQDGFAALIVSIILSVVMIVMATTLARTGFLARGAALDSEYKDISASLAEGCADVALIKIAQDPASWAPVAGGETVAVSDNNCLIKEVSLPDINDIRIIKVRADFNESVTNLRVAVDVSDGVAIVSWEEVASF